MTTRRVLVTGANRGIGWATALDLGRSGWTVLAAARRAEDAQACAEALRKDGCDAEPLAVDLAHHQGLGAVCARLEEERVDALVNNAGVYPQGGALEVELGRVREAFEVHVLGPLALCRAVVPGMRRRRFGRIVNVSSGYGSFAEGLEGPVAYSVTKAALNALTVKLAAELGPTIKVNAVCPGWVRTRMGGDGAERDAQDSGREVADLVRLGDDGPSGGFFREGHAIAW